VIGVFLTKAIEVCSLETFILWYVPVATVIAYGMCVDYVIKTKAQDQGAKERGVSAVVLDRPNPFELLFRAPKA